MPILNTALGGYKNGQRIRRLLPIITGRINKSFNPRGVSPNVSNEYGTRWGWSLSFLTGIADHPAGITTAVRSIAPAAPSQGSGRGIDLYANADNPPTSTTMPVTAGTPVTVSTWVRVNKAGPLTVLTRFHTGTAWVAAATASATFNLLANTWTRVSYTSTPPATSTHMGARLQLNGTVWVQGDTIDSAGLLMENAASVLTYKDGTFPGWGWDGTANASSSSGWN